MERYNWETRFETADSLMIHTMPGGRVEVIANLKTGVVEVKQDGNVVETHEGFYLSEYTEFLQGIADKAAELCAVNNK
ncbi:hypothetical protein [Odoribacter splanchnicus]|uniref:hypothetical protein n=1 Tax=Odoribacter splanchnicus TaxID=28118 RepID=UPI0032C131BE